MRAKEHRPRRSSPPLALAWVALLLPLLAHAISLFEKNHPRVEEGLKAYEGGDYQGALKSFDEAKKELPSSATLEFNRGNALYKLKRLEEANRAYHRAMETDRATALSGLRGQRPTRAAPRGNRRAPAPCRRGPSTPA